MSFAKKTVIITGASSTIGASIAKKFAKEDAEIIIVGKNIVKLENIAEDIKKCNNKIFVIKADFTKDNETKKVIEETIITCGKIDILINAFNIKRNGSILKGSVLKACDEVMNTNVRSMFHLSNLVLPHLIKTKGNIVNITNIAGIVSIADPEYFAYSVSNGAMKNFSKLLAYEVIDANVRVNAVCSGFIKDDIIEDVKLKNDSNFFKRFNATALSEPEEVANIVLFLASENAKSITGSTFIVDNGFSVLRP